MTVAGTQAKVKPAVLVLVMVERNLPVLHIRRFDAGKDRSAPDSIVIALLRTKNRSKGRLAV